MPVTELRADNLLRRLLDSCVACSKVFHENVTLITDDHGRLTEQQIEAVLVHLLDLHIEHDE